MTKPDQQKGEVKATLDRLEQEPAGETAAKPQAPKHAMRPGEHLRQAAREAARRHSRL